MICFLVGIILLIYSPWIFDSPIPEYLSQNPFPFNIQNSQSILKWYLPFSYLPSYAEQNTIICLQYWVGKGILALKTYSVTVCFLRFVRVPFYLRILGRTPRYCTIKCPSRVLTYLLNMFCVLFSNYSPKLCLQMRLISNHMRK